MNNITLACGCVEYTASRRSASGGRRMGRQLTIAVAVLVLFVVFYKVPGQLIVCTPESCLLVGSQVLTGENATGERCCRDLGTPAFSLEGLKCERCSDLFPPLRCEGYTGSVCSSLYNNTTNVTLLVSEMNLTATLESFTRTVEATGHASANRCKALFQQALCLTQAPQCNPNLSPPAANFLRLCDSQKCFDYYREFVDVCSAVGVNLTTYLPAAASQDTFCPGYVSGDCKEVPATIAPTIAEATDDTVESNPMLADGQVLTLTCTAMGTPRPQIDWYNGDSRITTSSRIQINKTEIGETTVVSMLVISSVAKGDSGTYECRVKNIGGSTSLQYPVVVSSVKSREEGEEMVQATPDHETVYDTIDEYEMASLSSRAEPMRGGGDSVNPAPEGEGPPTREEEEEGEKMQANPAYLPIEMSHKMAEEEYTGKAGPKGEGPPTKEETEGGGMQADSDHEATYESMDNDPIDEYEMASSSCRPEPMRGGGGNSVKASPEGEGPPTRGEMEGGEMKADSYHDPTYESMDNDHSDEYVVETLGSRAELRGGGGDSVKAGPEGKGPPTREEEEEEGEKMQANPAYLPIEMSYKSQESKYINVPS